MNYTARLKRNIKLFYIVDFLIGLDFVIPVWVAFHLRVLDYSQIAILTAFLYGLTMILELPTGALADMLGRKWTTALGWIFQGLGYAFIAFANSFTAFGIGYFIVAIGIALVSGASVAMVYDTFKELKRENEYSKFVAKSSTLFRIGLIVGTFTGGYLYQLHLSLPYLLMGLAYLVAVGFILLQQEPKIDTEKFTLTNYLRQTRDGFKEVFKTQYLKKLTLFYTLAGGITWACAIYFNQPFAKDLGFGEIEQSWLFGGIYLTSTSIIYLLSRNDKFLDRNKIYLGFPIILSLALLPGIIASKLVAPVLLLGILVCTSGRFAFLDRYANLEYESKYRATAVSALNMLVSLFVIIAVGLSGKLQDLYGTPLVFTLLGIVALFAMLPVGINLARHKLPTK
ncbi:MAG: major facilitator superfamily MFS1 [Microgenomates group bacterium Gr01-1014_5]|nr:MAG: major facilitator superfamily MFS1 [Microgenomates group bacterium Gr01-1014_5]